jgi:hypothetical protein
MPGFPLCHLPPYAIILLLTLHLVTQADDFEKLFGVIKSEMLPYLCHLLLKFSVSMQTMFFNVR